MGGTVPAAVSAQALSCAIPDSLPVPRAKGSAAIRRLPVAGYTLALSWSPQYCRGARGKAAAFQCGAGQRFGFVLHGLWPEGQNSQWPQYCRPARIVPPKVVRETLCTTPSVDLMQHEWAKHGTCGWNDPADYFATGRRLYQALRFPDVRQLSYRQDVTVGLFRNRFVAANGHIKGLSASSVLVRVASGGWLQEVWLCLDRQLSHARCSAGQQSAAPPTQRLRIWRGDTPSPRP